MFLALKYLHSQHVIRDEQFELDCKTAFSTDNKIVVAKYYKTHACTLVVSSLASVPAASPLFVLSKRSRA